MRSRLLNQECVELTRRTGVSTFDGAGQPILADDARPEELKVNIQPLPGVEIMQLPEADRRTQMLVMYSECLVLAKDLIKRYPDDAREENYEVIRKGDWQNYPDMRVTGHYRSVLGLIEAQ